MRFKIVEVPAWTGIQDTQTGETLLSVHTRVDATNHRDIRRLTQAELRQRVEFILDALNRTHPRKD